MAPAAGKARGAWSGAVPGRAAPGHPAFAPVGAADSRQGRALGSPQLRSRQAPPGQAAAWTPPRCVAAGDAAPRRAGEAGAALEGVGPAGGG